LALGRALGEAVILAKAYVTEAIKKACPVGTERVPVNQLYRLQELADFLPVAAKSAHQASVSETPLLQGVGLTKRAPEGERFLSNNAYDGQWIC
jgi:hypothetical protein